jgi:hypothetical protein
MAGFQSPSFSKNFPPQTHSPLREFTVGAPEEPLQQAPTQYANTPPSVQAPPTPQVQQSIKQARQEKLTAADRISDTGKRRIELLAQIGRLTKDVKIGDCTFTLRTLKAREMEAAMLATVRSAEFNIEASYETRRQQLARAIAKVDGAEMDEVLESNTIDAKLNMMEEMEEIVVSKLWDTFVLLQNEAKEKYGINTEAQAKEVVEDLKK